MFREKEKYCFSIPHKVFKRLDLHGCCEKWLYGKGLSLILILCSFYSISRSISLFLARSTKSRGLTVYCTVNKISYPLNYQIIREQEVVGSIPGRDGPKSLKLVVVVSPWVLRIMGIAILLALGYWILDWLSTG